MHAREAGDKLIQEVRTKAMGEVDYPGLAGEVRAAHCRVIVTIRVNIVVGFLRVTSEHASTTGDILVDPDVFLTPVVGQAWRGNIADRAVIRQGDKPVQHRPGIR